jgi:tRNA dimethylallyltransferase
MPYVVVITGPTASGKTALSLQLAEYFNSEIISADSRQIYRRLNIGTNKIKPEAQKGILHHLIDIVEPNEVFTAGDFTRHVNSLLQKYDDNDVVFLVGGTGFYLQALINGLDEMPEIPPSIRMKLTARLNEQGLTPLIEELYQYDPQTFETIDIQNPKRVLRALEVIHASGGKPFSGFKGQKLNTFPYPVLYLVIYEERNILYERINQRVLDMIQEGLLHEVEVILSLGFDPEINALRTIGYQEPIQYLNHHMTYDEMVRLIQQNTRHYAKRQLTWCRNSLKKSSYPVHWIKYDETSLAIRLISQLLER